MTDDVDPLVAAIAPLAENVAHLSTSLDHVLERTKSAETAIGRSKKALVFTSVALLVDILITIVVVSIFRDQEHTRAEVLCPLFSVFVGSYDPTSRKEGPDREKYEDTFRVIRQGYATLKCRGPIVPPRVDGKVPPR